MEVFIGTEDKKTFSFVNQIKRAFFPEKEETFRIIFKSLLSSFFTTRNQKYSLIVQAVISITHQMLAHLVVHTKPKILLKIEENFKCF